MKQQLCTNFPFGSSTCEQTVIAAAGIDIFVVYRERVLHESRLVRVEIKVSTRQIVIYIAFTMRKSIRYTPSKVDQVGANPPFYHDSNQRFLSLNTLARPSSMASRHLILLRNTQG